MVDATVLFEVAEGAATITLNRPDKLNAFTAAMHPRLARRVRSHRGRSGDPGGAPDRRRPRLLRRPGPERSGSGGTATPPPDLGPDARSAVQPTDPPDLPGCRSPVVLRGQWRRRGRWSQHRAQLRHRAGSPFGAVHSGVLQAGLVPDAGGTYVLPRLAGAARARGLALLGEPLTAEQAETWGLIWRVVDDDRLMAEATTLARHLATQPTHGLGLTKRALLASATNSLDAQLDLERDLQREAGRSEDYREGVTAFLASGRRSSRAADGGARTDGAGGGDRRRHYGRRDRPGRRGRRSSGAALRCRPAGAQLGPWSGSPPPSTGRSTRARSRRRRARGRSAASSRVTASMPSPRPVWSSRRSSRTSPRSSAAGVPGDLPAAPMRFSQAIPPRCRLPPSRPL